jgi:hypothetical protein
MSSEIGGIYADLGEKPGAIGKDQIMGMLENAGMLPSEKREKFFDLANPGDEWEEDSKAGRESSQDFLKSAIVEDTKKIEEASMGKKKNKKPGHKPPAKRQPNETKTTGTEAARAETPEPLQFPEAEIKEAVMHLVKPSRQFRRMYEIYEDFQVWLKPLSDREEKTLNEFLMKTNSTGDRRLRVDVVNSYFNEDAQTKVPGGRVESEYFYNPDAQRAMRRAELAMYVHTFDGHPFEKLSLQERLNFLEGYSPYVLNVVYEKALVPFLGLIQEATKQLVNF